MKQLLPWSPDLFRNNCPAISYASLILAYAVYRAYNLSFTYDEISSFAIMQTFTLDQAGETANTHLLNTLLMRESWKLFGDSELALRLPNVIACVVYLFASIRIGSYLQPPLKLSILILLTAMPFVLDFFSLARGYGLGLGFMLLSISFLVSFHTNRQFLQLLWSLLFGMIAVLANWTLLNYFIPLAGMLFLLVIVELSTLLKKVAQAITIAGITIAYIILILSVLLELKNKGCLGFGGRTGFFTDSIVSLGRCFAYFAPYGLFAKSVFIFLFAASILLSFLKVFSCIRERKTDAIGSLSVVFLFSILMPVLQHLFFQTTLPVERTAIMYYPPMIIILLYTVNELPLKQVQIYLFNFGLLSFFCIHTFFTLSLTRCYSWRYDSGTKKVIAYLKSKAGSGPVKLAVDFLHTPSVYFYKKRQAFDNLSITETAACWEYPIGLEELDPYNYNADTFCNEKMFYDVKKIISKDADYYYLDNFFIKKLKEAKVRFSTLQEYDYSNSALILIYK